MSEICGDSPSSVFLAPEVVSASVVSIYCSLKKASYLKAQTLKGGEILVFTFCLYNEIGKVTSGSFEG
jgi:hypothetical protein